MKHNITKTNFIFAVSSLTSTDVIWPNLTQTK